MCLLGVGILFVFHIEFVLKFLRHFASFVFFWFSGSITAGDGVTDINASGYRGHETSYSHPFILCHHLLSKFFIFCSIHQKKPPKQKKKKKTRLFIYFIFFSFISMKFSSYLGLSTVLFVGTCGAAWQAHQQFYPTVVHLATSKFSQMVSVYILNTQQ